MDKEVIGGELNELVMDIDGDIDVYTSYNNNKEKLKGLGASPAPIPPTTTPTTSTSTYKEYGDGYIGFDDMASSQPSSSSEVNLNMNIIK